MTGTSDLQTPFDVAVVTQTILRPTLLQAVRSIFGQDHPGRIQILVGVDKGGDDGGLLETLRAECPSNMTLTVIAPGYSTSRRHGGLYANASGGSLRTVLSYLANSRFVAYLDDDNWWAPSHLSSLLRAIDGKSYAFSRRTLVDTRSEAIICRDEWESLGPGLGVYGKGFGGWVDTSCLMVDKLACHEVLPAWSTSRFEGGVGEDRMVFERLKSLPFGATGLYTAFYRLVLDGAHPYLLWNYRKAGVELARFMPAERIPPDAVFDEYDRNEQKEEAAKAQRPIKSPFVGTAYRITYPKR